MGKETFLDFGDFIDISMIHINKLLRKINVITMKGDKTRKR